MAQNLQSMLERKFERNICALFDGKVIVLVRTVASVH